MQVQVPVQFNHYPLIVHHRHHHLPHLHFLVYCKVEEVEEEKLGEPVGAPLSGVGVLNALINTRLVHSAFQFSALCPRKIEVYIFHKCIYRKDSIYSSTHQIIKRQWPLTFRNFSPSLHG